FIAGALDKAQIDSTYNDRCKHNVHGIGGRKSQRQIKKCYANQYHTKYFLDPDHPDTRLWHLGQQAAEGAKNKVWKPQPQCHDKEGKTTKNATALRTYAGQQRNDERANTGRSKDPHQQSG